jgi:hypothetical protein
MAVDDERTAQSGNPVRRSGHLTVDSPIGVRQQFQPLDKCLIGFLQDIPSSPPFSSERYPEPQE